MERLIVTALPSKPGRFRAHLASTGALVVSGSKQPLVDGARELLARGFQPAKAAHDAARQLVPRQLRAAPDRQVGELTYKEGEKDALRACTLDAAS